MVVEASEQLFHMVHKYQTPNKIVMATSITTLIAHIHHPWMVQFAQCSHHHHANNSCTLHSKFSKTMCTL